MWGSLINKAASPDLTCCDIWLCPTFIPVEMRLSAITASLVVHIWFWWKNWSFYMAIFGYLWPLPIVFDMVRFWNSWKFAFRRRTPPAETIILLSFAVVIPTVLLKDEEGGYVVAPDCDGLWPPVWIFVTILSAGSVISREGAFTASAITGLCAISENRFACIYFYAWKRLV